MKKRNIVLLFLVAIIITFSINVYADSCSSCSEIISKQLLLYLDKYVYKPVKYITPAILIILTSIDFSKVVFSGNKDGMTKAWNNFLKRSVAALIIFFAPDIINLIVSFINEQSINSCMQDCFK